jgi:hypothetical protein
VERRRQTRQRPYAEMTVTSHDTPLPLLPLPTFQWGEGRGDGRQQTLASLLRSPSCSRGADCARAADNGRLGRASALTRHLHRTFSCLGPSLLGIQSSPTPVSVPPRWPRGSPLPLTGRRWGWGIHVLFVTLETPTPNPSPQGGGGSVGACEFVPHPVCLPLAPSERVASGHSRTTGGSQSTP